MPKKAKVSLKANARTVQSDVLLSDVLRRCKSPRESLTLDLLKCVWEGIRAVCVQRRAAVNPDNGCRVCVFARMLSIVG